MHGGCVCILSPAGVFAFSRRRACLHSLNGGRVCIANAVLRALRALRALNVGWCWYHSLKGPLVLIEVSLSLNGGHHARVQDAVELLGTLHLNGCEFLAGFPCVDISSNVAICTRFLQKDVQGYLAHKKTPTPLGPP